MKQFQSAAYVILLLLGVLEEVKGQNFQVFNPGQSFSCIALDSNHNIWSGTNKEGLHMLTQEDGLPTGPFTVIPISDDIHNLQNHLIPSIAADGSGNIWVAYTSSAGGIDRINTDNFSFTRYKPNGQEECFPYRDNSGDGLPTVNPNHIIVDKNNTVWSAFRHHSIIVYNPLEQIYYPGSVAFKASDQDKFTTLGTYQDYKNQSLSEAYFPYPANLCNPPVEQMPQTRSCQSVASNDNEVWLSVFNYQGKNSDYYPVRIVRFDHDANYLGDLTYQDVGFPTGGGFNAIYLGKDKNWLSTTYAGKGFSVQDGNNWQVITSEHIPCVFPANAKINNNAIWGNSYGNVFIGTTLGLLVYDGRGSVTDSSSYTFFTAENSPLPSNNITGGVSENDSIQWISTDNGIVRIEMGLFPNEEVSASDCNIEDISEILAQDHNVLRETDQSFHEYTVTTEICDRNSGLPNAHLCTVEYIYKMMKDSVALTAPIPIDYPLDAVSMALVRSMSKEAQQIYVDKVNAWVPEITADNPTGRILYLKTFLTTAQWLLYKAEPEQFYLWGSEWLLKKIKGDKTQEQLNFNPSKTIACQSYRLYSGVQQIPARVKFNGLDLFCGNTLEDVDYDVIYAFPDDNKYQITNYTAKSHILSPGKVQRSVVEECGIVKVITYGVGTQYCGDNLPGAMMAAGNMLMGSVMFKNIDLRLKYAFENQ